MSEKEFSEGEFEVVYKYYNLIDDTLIGERNVFTVGFKDIFDFIEKSTITLDERDSVLFTNYGLGDYTFWLSDAGNDKHGIWCVKEGEAFSYATDASKMCNAVRPAFNIDLSKIPFTKTTEVIS